MSTPDQFDRQVERFERLRDGQDHFASLRADLLAGITGDVLEIAPGPGFNFPYYTNINSLTAVDLSPKMVASAETKWQQVSTIPGEFVTADISTMEFPTNQFDAIVSTCSLCAMTDPVAVLNNVARWCKPDGRIYLLEHGLSDFRIVRLFQNLFEPVHYKLHACHCNRDIGAIVSAANLEVISYTKPRQYVVIDFMSAVVAQPRR